MSFEPDRATCNLVQEFLAEVRQTISDHMSGESFIVCRVCDEVDGHTAECPIPSLEAWMNAPDVADRASRTPASCDCEGTGWRTNLLDEDDKQPCPIHGEG